jgi:hypothetical protein
MLRISLYSSERCGGGSISMERPTVAWGVYPKSSLASVAPAPADAVANYADDRLAGGGQQGGGRVDLHPGDGRRIRKGERWPPLRHQTSDWPRSLETAAVYRLELSIDKFDCISQTTARRGAIQPWGGGPAKPILGMHASIQVPFISLRTGKVEKRMQQPPRIPGSQWQEPSDAEMLEVLLGQEAVDADVLKRADDPDELEEALRLLWSACRSAGPRG